MKKIFPVLLGIMAFFCINVLHQANAQTTPKASATEAKVMAITGTLAADEKSLVTDTDKKIWTVTNPEVLKGHAGQHVSITAQIDPAKEGEITVKSVKILTASAAQTPKTLEDNDDRLRVPPLYHKKP